MSDPVNVRDTPNRSELDERCFLPRDGDGNSRLDENIRPWLPAGARLAVLDRRRVLPRGRIMKACLFIWCEKKKHNVSAVDAGEGCIEIRASQVVRTRTGKR